MTVSMTVSRSSAIRYTVKKVVYGQTYCVADQISKVEREAGQADRWWGAIPIGDAQWIKVLAVRLPVSGQAQDPASWSIP